MYTDTIDGSAGNNTWNAITEFVEKYSTIKPVEKVVVENDNTNKNLDVARLSPKSLDLILEHEVGGGERYYNRALKHPTYPGGASGVTIGIGYDLGYNTLSQFKKDWGNKLPASDFNRLSKFIGIKRASSAARKVRDITIAWEHSLEVFETSTIPRFIKYTLNAWPGADELAPDAFGALVSIVFNRGASLSGSRRQEMKSIRAHVKNKDLKSIAMEIRSMKRLWVGKGLDGLLRRREDEAKLVESCI